MKPADIAEQRVPGHPALSPDGRHVVVAVTRPDLDADEYTGQLWIAPVDGSEPPRRLTHGWRDGAPVFSPDGRWLAFLRSIKDAKGAEGKAQLWVLPVAGGEPRRLTSHPLGADEAVWSPDSTRLAYTARVPEEGRYGTAEGVGAEAEPPRRITKLWYRVDNLGFLNDRPRKVFVVDALAEGAEPTQVTDGPYDDGDVDWSPSGDLLTFASARHDTWGDDLVVDIWVCNVDGSGVRALTDGTLAAGRPRFSPDGATVIFPASAASGPIISAESVWSVPVAGGSATMISDPERHNLAHATGRVTPVEDGVLLANEWRGTVELLLLPYDGGEPKVLLDGQRQVFGYARRGDVLVHTGADQHTWGELYAGDKQLSTWNDTTGALPLTEVDATAPDGYPVHGWVVRPAGPGPHPVLLMIHGGPFAQYGWARFDEAQVYAGAGYAVVFGNPRGSSGYGEAHGRAVVGDVGTVSERDLMALLDEALKADDLDATRVGVLGGSHGGFMTTWLAAHQGHRFKAAVSERAVNATDSFVGASDIGWFFSDKLWTDDPSKSPLTYADRIDVPILIVHSEHDWRCPVEQAQRLFVALKLRKATVEMLLFPGEGHELSRSGRPKHRVQRFEAILEWFAKYV